MVTNEVFQEMWYMPGDFIPRAISELIGINRNQSDFPTEVKGLLLPVLVLG
jgi:hypothetical protein